LSEIDLIDPTSHLRAFWTRTKFRERMTEPEFSSSDEADSILAAINKATAPLVSLIVIDGLDLPVPDVEIEPGIRLVELTDSFLDSWFGDVPLPGSVKRDQVESLFALEISGNGANPPWGPTLFFWDSPSEQIERLAQTWVSLLNLVNSSKVRAPLMYQRTESLMVSDAIQAVIADDPVWLSRYETYDEDSEPEEVPERLVTLRVQDASKLATCLRRLAVGKAKAALHSHRAETSRRFFDRVCRTIWSHHYPLGTGENVEANEDLLVDAVTALESIYLSKEQSKASHLAKRSAALLESDVSLSRALRKNVERVYKMRSAIVHGDPQQPAKDLRDRASIAELILRRSLQAFLCLDGDHDRVAKGAVDPAAGARNRLDAALDFGL